MTSAAPTTTPRESDVLDLARAFGEELRERRHAHRLTLAETARRLGIARPNCARSEKGLHTPRLETLLRAAEVFGVEPVAFFSLLLERARRIAAGEEPTS